MVIPTYCLFLHFEHVMRYVHEVQLSDTVYCVSGGAFKM